MPGDKTDRRLHSAAQTLNSGAIHLLRALRTVDRSSGLTPARLSALSVLVFGGPTPLGRLAVIEGVASPTMTRIVDGLCDLGLAERLPHPDSSRVSLVSATAEGVRLMNAAAERRFALITEGLRALPEERRRRLLAAADDLRWLGHHLHP